MILDKAKMAHEYLLRFSGTTVADAWAYADAMQAEADKREKEEAAQKRKEIREILNAPNTFVEREGQHFDDVEWQPDWSQAPAWANYIAVYSDCCNASYFEKEPKIISGYTWGGTDGKSVLTPIPVYTGNWQDSLRKRP